MFSDCVVSHTGSLWLESRWENWVKSVRRERGAARKRLLQGAQKKEIHRPKNMILILLHRVVTFVFVFVCVKVKAGYCRW